MSEGGSVERLDPRGVKKENEYGRVGVYILF